MRAEEALVLSKKYAQSLALGGATPIPGPDGINGREVQIQNNGTHIQWRYVGDPSWINIVALSDLKGNPGNDGVDGQNGINGVDGQDGADGQDGTDGQDGETPQFQMSGNTLQYKFPSQSQWTNLFTFPNSGDNNSGGYEPPQGGIPREDLAQDVQDSLDKANTALQQGDLPTPADLISADTGNILQVGTDNKLLATADDTINFPVPDYPGAVSILSLLDVTVGTVAAPKDGWIHRHSKIEGATYFGARLTINGANPDRYRLNQQSLDPAYAYENTSPSFAVKQGDIIETQIWTNNVGVIKANDILFSEIDYIGQAELPDGGWQRTQLEAGVQASLAKAETAVQTFENNTFTGENIFEGDVFLLKDGVYHNIGEQLAQLFNQMPTVIEVPFGSQLDLTPDVLENYAWFEVIGCHRMAFDQYGVQYPDSPKIFDYAKFTVQYNKWQNHYGALFLYGIKDRQFQNMTNAPSVNRGVSIIPLDPDSYDVDEPRPVLVYLHGGMPIGSSS